ncbi:hypothetical protein SOVF_200070 [Spinacia oleracea]|nr:hypothetical protein SOVF_200070 [Spinacia oleracea]
MQMANGSKSRLHNRAITISARSKRVARRSSQGRETQNNNNQVVRTEPDNNVELGNNGQLGNNTQSTTDLQDEELDGNNDIEQPSKKSAWKKRPRTFDWKLTAAAPGGPLSTELLRGYCGHVACDIWENNNEWMFDRVFTSLFPLVSDLVNVNTYSWASSTLAFLYRELGKASRAGCKQLAGPSTLLEAWIYEYFSHVPA